MGNGEKGVFPDLSSKDSWLGVNPFSSYKYYHGISRNLLNPLSLIFEHTEAHSLSYLGADSFIAPKEAHSVGYLERLTYCYNHQRDSFCGEFIFWWKVNSGSIYLNNQILYITQYILFSRLIHENHWLILIYRQINK